MVYRDVCKLLRKGASCAATAGTATGLSIRPLIGVNNVKPMSGVG
jgi:hypothetical protein